MYSAARCLLILVIGAALFAPSANAGGLVDILPDLIPGEIVAVSENSQTVRPDTDNPGLTRVDTGWVYGRLEPAGDLGALSAGAFAEFQNLPVGSAVAAFTYEFDPDTNVFIKSDQGLGPIFADRAQTLGKGKLNIGVSWSHIDFDEIEGTNLNHIPIGTVPTNVYVDTYSDTTVGTLDGQGHTRSNTFIDIPYPAEGVTYTLEDGGPDDPFVDSLFPFFTEGDIEDNVTPATFEGLGGFLEASGAVGPEIGPFTTSILQPSDLEANVHLEVELINFYASYGLFETVDIGIILPVLEIDMDAVVSWTTFDPVALQTEVNNALAGQTHPDAGLGLFAPYPLCAAEPAPGDFCLSNSFDAGLAGIWNQAIQDTIDNGDGTADSKAAQRAFFDAVTFRQRMGDSGTSQGIGDLMIRGKWRFLETKIIDAAGRLDIAFPTGSKKNFRSTGEYMWGVNLILSKAFGWFSPHANLGVQARTGGKENHQFRWTVGADAKLHDRVAASVDFLGNEDLYHDGIGDTQMALATGLKVNPWKNLVVSGAAVIRLNHQGLRADVIPSLSVEYTFF
jgi:hypothetical protein